MARPPDACPYPQPFSPEFHGCPAFQPRQFIPLDTLHRPLQPIITCRHLETRSLRERHRWYGACGLGDSESRARWVAQVGTARLAKIRELQRDMGRAIGGDMTLLWQAKGQQLHAYLANTDAGPSTQKMRQLSDRALGQLVAFLKSHAELLAEVGMPPSAMVQLTRLAFDRFIESRYSTEVSLDVPDSVLEGMSDPVRTFFRPSLSGGSTPG